MNTISEEQVLHNELSFEINQELIHLMKRIIEIQKQNTELKDNWNKLKEWLEEEIKHLEKSRYVSLQNNLMIEAFNEYGENKLRISKEFLFKMQDIEGGMNE